MITRYRYVLGLLLASAFTLIMSSCGSSSSPAANTQTFTITLSSANSVPAVTATATGSGTLTLNRDTGALTGSVTVSGLTGAITAAHIHEGIAGLTGGIIVTLEVDGTDPNQVNVPASTVLSETQVTAMRSSSYYINVHTAANAPGETRGQIVGENEQVIRVELNGLNEVPPVTTTNSGIAYVTVNSSTGVIRGNIRNAGLDDATAAHIHTGFAGTNGGVVVTMQQDAGDTGLWHVPDATTLGASDLANLLAGGTYFNVHTPANAPGEVRGQLAPANITVTRNGLDGSQEVPPVTTAASGIGYTTVDTGSGDIVANVQTSGTGGLTITAAHVHEGVVGTNGGIAVGLTEGPTGFWSATGTLTSDQLTAFNASGLYFNVHSDANASGEIRGQITP